MKGYIDNRWLGETGIGRFTREISSRLPELAPLGGSSAPANPMDVAYMSAWMGMHPRAFCYSPGFNVPVNGLSRYAFTIHDLIHLDVSPGLLKSFYYQVFVRRACISSAVVFTVSEYSKKRLIEWSGVSDSKVHVISCGISENFTPEGQKPDPGYSYLLCVGNRKTHKNEAHVVKAFARAKLDKNIKLVFSGERDDGLDQVIREQAVVDKVVFTGRLDEQALAAWYRGADALLFPSLYEGFGLPVVEAMACGTPVITSNVTSLPEVAGEAALLVSPTDLEELVHAIEQVVIRPDVRDRLISAGLLRCKAFSWDITAGRLREKLQEAFSG